MRRVILRHLNRAKGAADIASTPIFNPLTAAMQIQDSEGAPVLRLRSFARGRSFMTVDISQREEPDTYAALANWIDTGTSPVGPIAPTRQLEWWKDGLLIGPAELDGVALPSGPVWGRGEALALAIEPAAAPLFGAPSAVLPETDALTADFAANGWTNYDRLLTPDALAAVAQFYRTLSRGNWIKPDRHLTRQRIIHNDPVGRAVLTALVPLVSAAVGQPVRGSFSYLTEYRDAADLPRHTDRPACEYTVSIYLDYDPEPAGSECPWPLEIEGLRGIATLRQQRGGGVLFRGRALPHRRLAMPQGDTARMLLVCYVDDNFGGDLYD